MQFVKCIAKTHKWLRFANGRWCQKCGCLGIPGENLKVPALYTDKELAKAVYEELAKAFIIK